MAESIREIKEKLQAADYERLPDLFKRYEMDDRSGVRLELEKARKRLAAYEKELARIEELKAYEKEYAVYESICGIDEAGRGPLAGPVVAGAVILPKNCDILYMIPRNYPKKKEKSFMTSLWTKRWRWESVTARRSGLMKSIFYRQLMKQCKKLSIILQ